MMPPDHPQDLGGKRCLVTGANGFVGSHLADELIRRRADVRALVRKTSNLRWLRGKEVELVYGELREPKSLPPVLEGIDYVFHAAGVVRARDRDTYFRVNAGGTASLLEACRDLDHKPKVVFVSSLAAGGPCGKGPPIIEDDPPRPISFYGQSKLEAERIAAEYFDRLPIAIVRPPVIYGPRETDLFQVVKAAARWRLAPIVGDPHAPLSVVHVQDVARGLILAAQSTESAGKVYYVAGPETLTIRTMIDAVEKAVKHKVAKIPVPAPVVRVIAALGELQSAITKRPVLLNKDKAREVLAGGWACSIEKAGRELGFEPQVGIVEGMAATVQWYRQKKWIK